MEKIFTDAEIERLLQLNACIIKIELGFGMLTEPELALYKTITKEDRENIKLLMSMYQVKKETEKEKLTVASIDSSIISEFQNLNDESDKGVKQY